MISGHERAVVKTTNMEHGTSRNTENYDKYEENM